MAIGFGLCLLGATQLFVNPADDSFRKCRAVDFSVGGDVLESVVFHVPSNCTQELSVGTANIITANAESTISVNMPFHRLGDSLDLGSRRYLLSGMKVTDWGAGTTEGVIALIELQDTPTHQIVVHESKSYSSFDAYVMSHNTSEQALYVADYLGNRIMRAPWAGWPNALPAETEFVQIMSMTDIPELQFMHSVLMAAPEDNQGQLQPGVMLGWTVGFQDYYIYPENGSWSLDLIVPHDVTTPDQFVVTPVADLGSYEQFQVVRYGTGSPNYDIVDFVTRAIIISGQLIDENVPASVGPLSYFQSQPGRLYEVIASGGAVDSGQRLRPLVRYGLPMSVNGFSLSKGAVPTAEAKVGQDPFYVATDMETDGTPTLPLEDIQVSLWIGARESDNPVVDPVVDLGGDVHVLIPLATIDWTTDMTEHQQPGRGMSVNFPIANDPALEGNVILFQWVFVLPSGGVVVSDVFGTRIWGSTGPPDEQASPPVASASASVGPNCLKAAWKLLNARGGKLTPSKVGRVKMIMQALIRQHQKRR